MAEEAIATCAYCTGEINRAFGPRCPRCEVYHHRDCWIEFDGCTTYGCPESPDMKAYQTSEVSNG